MMSISDVQRKRIYQAISSALYASGEKPTITEVLKRVGEEISKYPLGQPRPMSRRDYEASGIRLDPEVLNYLIMNSLINLEDAYSVTDSAIQEVMSLNTFMRKNLERLSAKRKELASRIDDYLLVTNNADGYFYSISDNFSTLNSTDLNLTTALVDPSAGVVSLPTNSDLTKRVTVDKISNATFQAYSYTGRDLRIITKAPFSGAVDGLTNTVWASEVETKEPMEVIFAASINIGSNQEPMYISKVEIDPYTINPVQVWMGSHDGGIGPQGVGYEPSPEFYDVSGANNAWSAFSGGIRTGDNFGGTIQTLDYKGVFVGEPRVMRTLNIIFRKTEPDYVTREGGVRYHYMFGAKDLNITEHIYDREAVWVSQPITLPEEFENDFIDAVSLKVDENVPLHTNIKYYVAPDVASDDIDGIGGYAWREIVPTNETDSSPNNVIRFEGTNQISRTIKSDPGNGLELIPLASTGAVGDLNPAPVFPDVSDSFYRIAELNDDFILKSLQLEEGVDTMRVLSRDISYEPGTGDIQGESIEYWTDYVSGVNNDVTKTYVDISGSNTFFDGSNVGQDFQSIYADTSLEVLEDLQVLFKTCRKSDVNSKTWAVKVYLNGREIADMPVGTDEAVLPWKFNKGLNHIALLITIPAADNANPDPYQGQVELMAPDKLGDWGIVKLGNWQYVDPFHMKYNQTGQPRIFTVVDRIIDGDVVKKEIVSPREPTDNFRVRYTKPIGKTPSAIRLRADLSRELENPHLSPILDLWRLRFAYGNQVF